MSISLSRSNLLRRIQSMRKLVGHGLFAAGFICVALAGSKAQAQEQTIHSGTEIKPGTLAGAYFSNRDFVAKILKYAKGFDLVLGIACNDGPYQIVDFVVSVQEPVSFSAASKQPTAGTWIAKFEVDRCRRSKWYNLLMTVQPDGKIAETVMFPGTTITSREMQPDVAGTFDHYARSLDPVIANCDNVHVFDTKMVKDRHTVTVQGKEYRDVWIEEWTLRGCNTEFRRQILFVPDPTIDVTRFYIAK